MQNRQYESLSGSDFYYGSTADRLAVQSQQGTLDLLTNQFLDSRIQFLSLNPTSNPTHAVSKQYVDDLVAAAVIGQGVPVSAGPGLALSGSTLSVVASPSIQIDSQNRLILANGSVDSAKISSGVLNLSNTTASTSTETGSLLLSGGLAFRGQASGESLHLFSNGGAGNQQTRIRFSPWSARPGLHSGEIAGVDNGSGGGYLSLRAVLGSGVPTEALRVGESGVTAYAPLFVSADASSPSQVPRLSQMQSAISTAAASREVPLSFTGPNLVRTSNTISINSIPTFQAVVLTGNPVNDVDAVSQGWVNNRIAQSTSGLQQSITAGSNMVFSGQNQFGVVNAPIFSGVVSAAQGNQPTSLTTLSQVQSLVSAKGDPVQVSGSNLTLSGVTVGTSPNQSHSQMILVSTEQSTSTTTGSLRLAGGLGLAKDLRSTGNIRLDTPGGATLSLFSPTGGSGTETRIDFCSWTGRTGVNGDPTSIRLSCVDDGAFSGYLRLAKSSGQSGALIEKLRVDDGGILVQNGSVRCSSTVSQSSELPNLGQVQAMISAIPPPAPVAPVLYNTSTMAWNVNLNSADYQTRAGGETSNLAFVSQGASPQFTYPDRGVFVPSFSGLVDIQFYFLDRGGSGSCSLTLTMTRDDLVGGERVATIFFHNVTGASIDWASGICRVESGVRYFYQGRSNGITSPAPAVEVKMRRVL